MIWAAFGAVLVYVAIAAVGALPTHADGRPASRVPTDLLMYGRTCSCTAG